jgi:hypothetical protein
VAQGSSELYSSAAGLQQIGLRQQRRRHPVAKDETALAIGAGLFYSVAMSAPRVGDVAPEIVLPDSTGEQRSLSSLAPCVLIFYRGQW